MTTLLALGDICPGDHYFTLGHGVGSRFAAGAQPLAPIADLLHSADVVFANLEGALAEVSDRIPPVECEVFRGSPSIAQRLREAGITVAQVANNHSMQHGAAAFATTVDALRRANIAPLGLRDRYGESAPVIHRTADLAVGLLGYSLVPERYTSGTIPYATGDAQALCEQVRTLAAEVDAVVVSLHWGDETVGVPAPDQIALARELIDAGARVVLGHHSHVFQPVVRYRHGIIAYSLGDAVFDLFWHRPLVYSAVLRVTLARDASPEWDLFPVRFGRDYRLHPMPSRQARSFRARLARGAMLLENFSGQQYASFYELCREDCERTSDLKKLPFFLANMGRGRAREKIAFMYGKLMARWAAL